MRRRYPRRKRKKIYLAVVQNYPTSSYEAEINAVVNDDAPICEACINALGEKMGGFIFDSCTCTVQVCHHCAEHDRFTDLSSHADDGCSYLLCNKCMDEYLSATNRSKKLMKGEMSWDV